MKIDENGSIREMTAEEVQAFEKLAARVPAPSPGTEERLSAVEAAILTMMGELPNV